jgi:hypothetical protein
MTNDIILRLHALCNPMNTIFNMFYIFYNNSSAIDSVPEIPFLFLLDHIDCQDRHNLVCIANKQQLLDFSTTHT